MKGDFIIVFSDMFDTVTMVTVSNWTQTCFLVAFRQQSVSLSFQDASQDFIFCFSAHAFAFCIHILQIPITKRAHTSKHNYFQIFQNNVMLLWKLRSLCRVMVMLRRERKTRTWESEKRSVKSQLQNKCSASCV